MFSNKNLKDYTIYDTVYGDDVPSYQFYLTTFNLLPSTYGDQTIFDEKILDYFRNIEFKEVLIVDITTKRKHVNKRYLLINEEKQVIVELFLNDKKDNSYRVQFLYNVKNGDIKTQLNWNEFLKFEKPKKKSNINLVKMEMGHLDVEEYDLQIPNIDLKLNYGDEFVKIHDLIIGRLNRNYDKGIILLHGDPGTGKTTYIKYLSSLIEEKEILFIPPSMAEALSEPSIIPFLMDHKNSILIIEDGERVISDRETNGSAAGVSNILNLTDGILGDCLNIQIIATFNMKREKIDQALLRKGRLIAEHKFENLTIDETNRLLKHLNKDYVSKERMSLADIYNVDVEIYRSVTNNKIGFNR